MYEVLKKRFGQNFLIDRNILKKISDLIIEDNLNIVEIGPGDGRLTDYILNYKPKILEIIEIDEDLKNILNQKFSKYDNVKITYNDILKYDLRKKIDLIISNLPYNISSQILVKICLLKTIPNRLILMFQKEFAQRLLDKKLNSLNTLVKCFYDIHKNFDINRKCFRPIPKVDSTVLLFSKKQTPLLDYNEINSFIDLKRKIFSFKRKTLKNLLKEYDLPKGELELNKRVESISLELYVKIFRKINT